jgi:hypothetical protein
MTHPRVALLLTLFLLAAAACTGRGAQKPPASHGVLPQVASVAEGLAEDIQTDLDTLGWTDARARLAELQTNRSALRTEVLSDPATLATYEAALDSLAAQIGRRDRLAALQSANRMGRVLLAVAANYDLTVPVQLGLLDVAGRDAMYHSEAGNWPAVTASVAELRSQYAIVQAHVAAKDAALGARLAQRLADLDAAVSAKDAARIRVLATGLLEDVDLAERTY